MNCYVSHSNGYYGSEGASLNLTTLFEKFQAGTPPESLGANREYNVDLIPKFIMATGNMTKMLLHTGVTKYLDFKSIAGSFVVKGDKILKIPATPKEALASPLMNLLEKRRFRNFLIFIDQYKYADVATHQGRDLTAMTMRQLYSDFGLVPDTHQFISHAMCLELDEKHMDQPALKTVENLQTYCYSLARYGTSPVRVRECLGRLRCEYDYRHEAIVCAERSSQPYSYYFGFLCHLFIPRIFSRTCFF
jgi:Rab GDP dissociation inhibitor